MKTVHVVAVESESSGLVNWYYAEAGAIKFFTESVATIDYRMDDINRWAMGVPDDATEDEIDTLAVDAMWNLDYRAIERRAATEGDDIFVTNTKELT